MPRIFDNIDNTLVPAIQDALTVAVKADFCVGYFNLRGWRLLGSLVDQLPGGDGSQCRLLVGMNASPLDEVRTAVSLSPDGGPIDQQTAIRLKRQMAEEFRQQLSIGVPTNEDERALRQLRSQLMERKVVVKLFLRHNLHAKLYLLHRDDKVNPMVGFVGSSNLTLAGLSKQGELNVDVLDHDACSKLAHWFEDRWIDKWCLDITDELIELFEESWVRETPILPYHIYLKMAYHLSNEARAGLNQFNVPADLQNKLLDFQSAAVRIAAHHLNKRGGVVIGDVVGLGKTIMAVSLARILQDDYGSETLIICPKNLVKMWERFRHDFRLLGKVVSLSAVGTELPKLRRHRVVLIDESHNLRNREGKRYRAIQNYIAENESKCILLSATPYNKSYLDLSSQLALFVPEDYDLGIRPERKLREIGETEFIRRYQARLRSLAAFEKSEYPDDWRELMRLFLVRRTRSFIISNYAERDEAKDASFLSFPDGSRFYFPKRTPRTVKIPIDDDDSGDQYARLYSQPVVDAIGALHLPRYGLGNYVRPNPDTPPTPTEQRVISGLSRSGQRLKGFCRTNLFKRLESGGPAFIQSLYRHALRNQVALYALETGQPVPIGAQSAEWLDARLGDSDPELEVDIDPDVESSAVDAESEALNLAAAQSQWSVASLRAEAERVYAGYSSKYKSRFKWMAGDLFDPSLREHLEQDCAAIVRILDQFGQWNSDKDVKVQALVNLITQAHSDEKILVFTQFADTVKYLTEELSRRGVVRFAGVTGSSDDPTELAWRFSPISNDRRSDVSPDQELRVLIATDVLSEGQNLQDSAVIVNYDLPWAIIRLIQRAGRVDRIGQQQPEVLCYSFLPADGVERVLQLRRRVRTRLRENAEVVGSDESFFEDDSRDHPIIDLYNEKAGVLDGEQDNEVDLASFAYQIWKNAIDVAPELEQVIPQLPPVSYTTKSFSASETRPAGALVFVRTADDVNALAWVDEEGNSVSESQLEILRAAESEPHEPPLERSNSHHALVGLAVRNVLAEERTSGGQLGRPSGARFHVYERLKSYAIEMKGTLFDTEELNRAVDDVYRYPLRPNAVDTLNRQLRAGIGNEQLAQLVMELRSDDRLSNIEADAEGGEPLLICSMGLSRNS